MAYESEIAALEAAAASGQLTIESNGERVTYRSMTDLVQALNYFRSRAATGSDGLTASNGSRSSLASYEGF